MKKILALSILIFFGCKSETTSTEQNSFTLPVAYTVTSIRYDRTNGQFVDSTSSLKFVLTEMDSIVRIEQVTAHPDTLRYLFSSRSTGNLFTKPHGNLIDSISFDVNRNNFILTERPETSLLLIIVKGQRK